MQEEIRLLRVSEAAQMLKISRATVYQLIWRGHLPSIKIGRSRRLLLKDLRAFVESLSQRNKGGAA